MKKEINTRLEEKAMEETTPFCYPCYHDCPDGICPDCHSDDLMRHLPGVGVEYGVEWTFEHLLRDIGNVDTDEIFEDMIEGAYGETATVGFVEIGTVEAMKTCDPVSWRIAKDEYIDGLIEDEALVEIGDNFYRTSDIEDRL